MQTLKKPNPGFLSMFLKVCRTAAVIVLSERDVNTIVVVVL